MSISSISLKLYVSDVKNNSINYKKTYSQAMKSIYVDRSKVQVPDIFYGFFTLVSMPNEGSWSVSIFKVKEQSKN
jgi:hypothetical protein